MNSVLGEVDNWILSEYKFNNQLLLMGEVVYSKGYKVPYIKFIIFKSDNPEYEQYKEGSLVCINTFYYRLLKPLDI